MLFRSDVSTLRKTISDELLPYIDLNLPLLILGDFNLDLLKNQDSFLAFMQESFHCKQHIDKLTTGSSVLDLVFATVPLISCQPV